MCLVFAILYYLYAWRNCHRFDLAKVDFHFLIHTLWLPNFTNFLLGKLWLGIKRSLNPEILRNGKNNAKKWLSIKIIKVKRQAGQ
jgi:hypothetical protein